MTQPASPPYPPVSVISHTDQPHLWQALEPSRQQQLAQCLATLLRRLRQTEATSAKEVVHEPA